MKHRIARNASAVLVGAIMLCLIPVTNAFALATISSVSPSASPRGLQKPNVQINGSFFNNLTPPSVSFGPGIAVSNVRVQSGSIVLVDLDITTSAPFGVHTVTVDDGLGSDSCQCFTVTPPPSISMVSPSRLAVGTTSPITFTITGTGFLPNAVVQVSGMGVTAVTQTVAGDGKSMTVTLSASSTAITGARNITVMNTDGQSATCTACISIVGPPKATGIFPAQRAGGLPDKTIDIVGSGFDATTNVTFSGSEITIIGGVQRISGTNLKVTIHIPSGAPLGAHDVTFDNPDNGGHSVCAACFTITGPTSVSIVTPSTVNGPIVATFSQPVSGVSSSNSFVRLTGTTSNLPTLVICVDQDGAVTNCATGYVKQAVLRPTSLIVPGQHYTVHIAAGSPAVVDFGGLPVTEQTRDFTGGLVQPGEGPATFLAWRAVRTSAAYGGSYVVDDVAGASASYRFTGSSIVWYTNIGPSYGIADLYVDGVKRAIVNSYSATTHYRAAFTVSGLSYAAHTLTVRVRGVKGNSHGTGTNVAIDAFSARGILVSTPSLSYVWGTVATSAAFGSLYSWANEAGASASFTFRGTSIEWDTVTGPQMGVCMVYIDGVLKATVNNYSTATTYHVKKMFTGLTDTVHSIRIIVSGTHQAASSGSFIVVDGWVVT